MSELNKIHKDIVCDLAIAGKESPYATDADEPDSRYKSYGVRADGKRRIYRTYRPAIRRLPKNEQIELAKQLVNSGFGDQQTIALLILERLANLFTPSRFGEIDAIVRRLHGWSKVDAFTGSFLADILFRFPEEFICMVRSWNSDSDMWLRRASVVLFTRKVAKSGRFNDTALQMCDNLTDAKEDLVQKGVGWALKDLMRSDKERVLHYVKKLRQQGKSSTITLYAIRDLKGRERAEFLAIGR